VRHLAKHVDLDDPEAVKLFVAGKGVRESTKEKIAYIYDGYVKWRGLAWEKPVYQRDTELPFIPLEKEIDHLILASSGKTSTFLQFLKESACRPVEAWRTKWSDVDFERSVIYINRPAKRSRPRAFRPSAQLTTMIRRLPRTSGHLFRFREGSNFKNFTRTFYLMRRRVARTTQNPWLMRISFKTLRHWKATMEYHRTKDILHVKELLGHKSIKNTLIYTHLVNFESDDWICRVANTLEEVAELVEAGVAELVEAGFEYVTDFEGRKVFRKRK
jgi:integrase